ncbi:MAG: DUF362 domain-containing protein [Deltaproteobacteria bacterium]|nr:DUF362 domain-containing protein [Deltaproteobacteria bacterium]
MFTRRGVIKIFGISSLLAVFGKDIAMAQFFFRPGEKRLPRHRVNAFTAKDGAALIGVSGGKPPSEMIEEAVSLIGGFERLELKGKSVLVKPNVVSGEKNPATTNPEVVAAVVKLLYGRGAKKVYVGDMSALLTLSTVRNMKRNGIFQAAKEAGAEVIVFEDYGWVEVPLEGAKYIKNAYVTEWLYNVDVVVNLPVIKTHRSASYSICLKNFIGCTHLKQRPYLVDESHWEELVSEFNLACAPDLNIVDGTVSMIEGGPWKGLTAPTDLIMASGDRVGADVAGLGVIKSFGKWAPVTGKDVWDQSQIKRAVELGVGRGREGMSLAVGTGGAGFAGLMEKVRAYARL